MEPNVILSGNWKLGDPAPEQHDLHTACTWEEDDYLRITRGVGAFVNTTSHGQLNLHVSRPGMHSLWWATAQGRIFWHEHRWALQKQMRLAGGTLPKRVEAGTTVIYDGTEVTIAGPTPYREVLALPSIPESAAVDRLWERFLAATQEMYDLAGRPRITALASAGTDSTMGIIALKEIGADVHAISVGRSIDDFDPQFAQRYAAHLDVPFTLLSLPSDDAGLRQLAIDTIAAIEMCEMSNTMMAMCTTLVRRWAIENGRPCLWKGHYADDLLGTNNVTYGTFRKQHPEQTDQQWTDFRSSMYQDIIPNDMQVAQVCRRGKTFWRSTFYHPKVQEFVWQMPIKLVPLELRKPLFEAACDRYLAPNMGSWHHQKRKVGYYSGAGIGKVRLENPIIQDANLRALYKQIKEQLT